MKIHPRNLKLAKIIPAVALSILASAAILASQQTTNPDLIAKLEAMQSKHDWQARTRTGAPKLLLLMHQRRVNRVIDELKTGNTVDSKDIDALYKEHYRGVPGRVD